MPIAKKINKNFFKIWTNNMAYILGFMFADGGVVSNNRGSCYFSLYSKDKGLLEEIKSSMNSEHKVAKRSIRSGQVFRLQIGSKEIVEDLYKHGLYNNKVHRMTLPKIPIKFTSDFVRGFFDGDGNVWTGLIHKDNKKPNITIQTSFTSASKNFLTTLKELLSNFDIDGGSLFLIKNKNCYRLTYSVNDSLKLYEFMYNRQSQSVDALFLLRKKEVFEKYITLAKVQL